MTSNVDHARVAIELIGGDSTLDRLRARGVESCENGVCFLVPILGGLVRVEVVRNEHLWNIALGFDVTDTMPELIKEVPDGHLGLMIAHLFRL